MEEGAWEEEDVEPQGQEGASEQQGQEGTMLEPRKVQVTFSATKKSSLH